MDDFDFFDFTGSYDAPAADTTDWWGAGDWSGSTVAPADTSDWWGAGDWTTPAADTTDWWGAGDWTTPAPSYGMTPEETAATDWASLYADTSNGSPAGVDPSMYGVQDFGNVDIQMPENQYGAGGYSSGWQTTPDGSHVMIQDDGSAIAIDKSGQQSGLDAGTVANMIKQGALNTYSSGYNTATGGGLFGAGGTPSLISKLLGGSAPAKATPQQAAIPSSESKQSSGGSSAPAATGGIVAPKYNFLEGISSMLPIQTVAQMMSQRG